MQALKLFLIQFKPKPLSIGGGFSVGQIPKAPYYGVGYQTGNWEFGVGSKLDKFQLNAGIKFSF